MADSTQQDNWVRLSVNFWTDPRVLGCDLPARSVFVASIAIAGQHVSDGVVHRETLRMYVGDDDVLDDAASQLVNVGLWETMIPHMSWRIRSYLKWNESRLDVHRRRIRKVLGGELGRHRRSHKKKRRPGCWFCTTGTESVDDLIEHDEFEQVTGYEWLVVWPSQSSANGLANPGGMAEPLLDDDDDDDDETVSFTGRGNPRGGDSTPATISAGWKPSARTLNDAGKAGATAAMIERHIPRFRDHHLAKGTRAVDFGPMFINWIRRALELEQPNGTTPAPAGSTGERRVTAGYHRYIDFTDDQWT